MSMHLKQVLFFFLYSSLINFHCAAQLWLLGILTFYTSVPLWPMTWRVQTMITDNSEQAYCHTAQTLYCLIHSIYPLHMPAFFLLTPVITLSRLWNVSMINNEKFEKKNKQSPLLWKTLTPGPPSGGKHAVHRFSNIAAHKDDTLL